MEHNVIWPQHDTFMFAAVVFVNLVFVLQCVNNVVDFDRKRLDVDVAEFRILKTKFAKYGIKMLPCLTACNIPTFDVVAATFSFAVNVVAIGVEAVDDSVPALSLLPVARRIREAFVTGERPSYVSHELLAVREATNAIESRTFEILVWDAEFVRNCHDASFEA